jgi:hypothetical protein
MAFFDARSCSVQYVVFDPSTGRCAPVDPVLDYDEKSVPTAAPSADALLAFACESETSRLNEFAILITCGSLQGGHRISERQTEHEFALRTVGTSRHMPPIHANEVDRAIGTVPQCCLNWSSGIE